MESEWNQRYSQSEYVYGTEPNVFFQEELSKLKPGRILLPAEGEGRNAVYAAGQGWDVYAFDSSIEAKAKAMRLASQNEVTIKYDVLDYKDVDYNMESFDAIAMIYAHNMSRQSVNKRLQHFLKKGGIFIIEGFSVKQINSNSGGPKKLEMLYTVDDLKFDFDGFSRLKVWEQKIELREGHKHNGLGTVVRLLGVK